MQLGNGHYYIESSFLYYRNPLGLYNPPSVPSGAAQWAHYPAGTRGDIQAVTRNGVGKDVLAETEQVKLLVDLPESDTADI